jgi:hypothetical protein
MTAPDALMSVQSLVVRYGSALALQGVPLELNAGDVVAVPGSKRHRAVRSPRLGARRSRSAAIARTSRLAGTPGSAYGEILARYLSESAGTASA